MARGVLWGVALGLVAAGAVARAQVPVIVVPGTPPSASPALPPAFPPSSQLLQLQAPSAAAFGGQVAKVTRGGYTLVEGRYADGLELAVTGSDRAVLLAQEAHRNLVTGTVLSSVGNGVLLASLVGTLAADVAITNASSSQFLTATLVGLGGLLVGGIIALVATPYFNAGLREEFESVNSYNANLLDGRLRSPASQAFPPR